MSLRQFAARRPVLSAVGCAALQFALTVAILQAGRAFAPAAAFGKVKLVAFASTVILPLLLVQLLGLWRKAGLGLLKLQPLPVLIALLLTAGPFLALGVHEPKEGWQSLLVIQLFNAFGEELLFRGVIFALLAGLPMWRAILLNGVLFGAMHLIHGVMDVDWRSAAWKMAVTSVAGMMFTAMRYAGNSLWLVVALHMGLNVAMLVSNLPAIDPTLAMAAERWANLAELGLVAWLLTRREPRAAGQARRKAA